MKTIGKFKKILLAAIFTSAITSTKAQTVSYKILENDPDKRNLFIHVNPFNVQAYFANITIGYNVQATWLAAKNFQFQVDFRKAYLDGDATGVFSPKGLKKASQIEVGGVFNLSNKLKNCSHRVVLSSSSSGRYNYTQSISVMAEARKIFGIRGGFVSFFNNHHLSSFSGKNDVIMKGKSADGQIRYVYDSLSYEAMNFTIRSTGIYAGIDFKTIKHLLVNTDSYGEKGCKTVNNFYLDVLFTPLVVYKLKPNTGQTTFNNVDINISDNKRRLLGWRFGWQYITNKSLGFNAKMEIGQQPGLYKQSFFMALGFGFTIGLKTKVLPI